MHSHSTIALGLLLTTTMTPGSATGQCTSGWTGSASYKRSHNLQNNDTHQRVSGRGTETTRNTITTQYSAQLQVSEGDDPGASAARAAISYQMTSAETVAASQQWVCPGDRTARTMTANTTQQSEAKASSSGVEADVSISLDEETGRYSVGIGVPSIKGEVKSSSTAAYSGQCANKPNTNSYMAPMPTEIEGVRFVSDGQTTFDPRTPNRLSGNYSLNTAGVTETLTWNLTRCGSELKLIDLKFEDMAYPTWNAWRPIYREHGTTDGNIVRVIAVVANNGKEAKRAHVTFRETYKGDQWNSNNPDKTLSEDTVEIPAGTQRQIQFEWDSSGYAWYDDRRPRYVQRIKVELDTGEAKADELTRDLKVKPKPVILVHGLWSTWQTWETWQNILTTSHSYDWKAYPVGERPEHGKMNTGGSFLSTDSTYTVDQNALELARYISFAQKDRNAWHIDLVAHSMGGLISRRYIHKLMPANAPDGKPQVTHLAMLGTPNMGSSCAEVMDLAFDSTGLRVEAVRQLRRDAMEAFNAETTNRKGVLFSVLAGNPLPTMCKRVIANDGVVDVPSARWTIADSAESGNIHTDLTGTSDFSAFVMPRLAVGPGKQGTGGNGVQAAAAATPPSESMAKGAANASTGSSVRSLAAQETPDSTRRSTDDFTALRHLLPSSEVVVTFPVKAALGMGVTFVAASDVSVILLDDKGAIIGQNLANSAGARQPFRSIVVDEPVSTGTLKLMIKNEAAVERQIVVNAWESQSALSVRSH